jgi:hypothetical protein
MTVLHASRPLELAPGKTGILTSKDKLPALIDQLTAAAKAGEFDDIFVKGCQAVPEAQGGACAKEQGALRRDSRLTLTNEEAHMERERRRRRSRSRYNSVEWTSAILLRSLSDDDKLRPERGMCLVGFARVDHGQHRASQRLCATDICI